jgi:2-iminobutanoate/2-iminopropanoate deaminase
VYEIISHPDLPVFGPYSPAVRIGDLIVVSAQIGVDPVTGTVPTAQHGESAAAAECRQVFANLARVLDVSGSSLDRVARTTMYYVDLADLPSLNAVYADVFGIDPPARSAMIVGLPGGRRVAIDAIAARRESA